MKAIAVAGDSESVMQRYLPRPLLLDGMKFDIRLYQPRETLSDRNSLCEFTSHENLDAIHWSLPTAYVRFYVYVARSLTTVLT